MSFANILGRGIYGMGHEKDPQELKDGYLADIPMGRWGVPQDLDGTVVYLASEASGFVTGQNIHVNGGTTVH